MRLDKDDPRIIDFALGELDAEEHQAIAAALESEENAAAKAAVEDYRKLIAAASTDLAQEDVAALGEEQRDEILAQAEKGRSSGRSVGWLIPLMAAAGFLLIAGSVLVPNMSATMRRADTSFEMAQREREIPAALEEQMEALGYLGDTESAAESLTTRSLPSEHMVSETPPAIKPTGPAGNMSARTRQQAAAAPPPPPSPPPAPEAGRSSGSLKNFEIGGSIRVRGNYYDSDGVTPSEVQSENGAVALSTQVAPEQRAELDALGYLDSGAGGFGGGGGINAHHGGSPLRPELVETWEYRVPSGSEQYAAIPENPFKRVTDEPLSTFSIDVDTASYSNVRRFLTQGSWPPPNAVRIEELLNYFDYDYPQPEGDRPFAVAVAAGPCPWRPAHTLAKIGLQGRTLPESERPRGNFVFLLDVSGSMDRSNKLPLVKESMRALLQELRPDDRVGIVTYASNSAVHLRSTTCDEKEEIERAIESLGAGGSTHGSAGIRDAYTMARRFFVEGGVNRVILATDGDFNVGTTDHESLMQLIEREAKSNVFLTALGFGMGNIKDHTLEQLADRGNGHYAYIDDFKEARKVLVEQLNGALVTIAKDVKIQVEFNPAQVGAYRLIGYENRMLAAKDFNDDTKDAGEIGAGHTVTALYEIVPPGVRPAAGVDPLKYQDVPVVPETETQHTDELMTVKLRWKEPEGDTSEKIEVPVRAVERRSRDLDFAAAVAGYGMILRQSRYGSGLIWTQVRDLAEAGQNGDEERREFLDLVIKAKTLTGQ